MCASRNVSTETPRKLISPWFEGGCRERAKLQMIQGQVAAARLVSGDAYSRQEGNGLVEVKQDKTLA